MKIDGRELAQEILKKLRDDVRKLKRKKITPHIAVILVGSDPASLSFIAQKAKAAAYIGAKLTLHHFKKTPLYQSLAQFILELSENPTVHGIIIQRPLPSSLSAGVLTNRINIHKDIDGFLSKSTYDSPIGLAILMLIQHVFFRKTRKKKKVSHVLSKTVLNFLKRQNTVIVGRGETGGKPIAETFQKYHIPFMQIHSGVDNPEDYLKVADIIISAVGKSKTITSTMLTDNVILLGVGVTKENGKLVGDYSEHTIDGPNRYYTPMPGGTGPVNVACLMINLIEATKILSKKRKRPARKEKYGRKNKK